MKLFYPEPFQLDNFQKKKTFSIWGNHCNSLVNGKRTFSDFVPLWNVKCAWTNDRKIWTLQTWALDDVLKNEFYIQHVENFEKGLSDSTMEQFFKKNLLVIEMPYLYSLAKYNFKTTSRLSIARGEHRKKINEKKTSSFVSSF